MPRKMLVVHESPLLQKIVTSYAMAELSDVLVETADTAEQGLKRIGEESYDLILSANQMAGLTGIELFKKTRAGGTNQETPFVIMTSADSLARRQQIQKSGVDRVLRAPFTAAELALLVNELADPREDRSVIRYSIPGTEALFHLAETTAKTKVLNVCLKGILCELTYNDRYVAPLRPFRLDLLFPPEYGRARAEQIQAVIMRFNVLTWTPDLSPELVRVAYKFTDIPSEAANTLEMVMTKAGQDLTLASDSVQPGGRKPSKKA